MGFTDALITVAALVAIIVGGVIYEFRRSSPAGHGFGLHRASGSEYEAAKSAALHDLSRGLVPRRFDTAVPLPLLLDGDESVVWAFGGVRYLDKERRRRAGHSYGFSARVARGLNYGERIYAAPEYDYRDVELGSGLLAITDKAIRFRSADGSVILRYRYSEIDDVQPFSNGIGVHRESRSNKPQQSTFICGSDGPFLSRLVIGLWQRRTVASGA